MYIGGASISTYPSQWPFADIHEQYQPACGPFRQHCQRNTFRSSLRGIRPSSRSHRDWQYRHPSVVADLGYRDKWLRWQMYSKTWGSCNSSMAMDMLHVLWLHREWFGLKTIFNISTIQSRTIRNFADICLPISSVVMPGCTAAAPISKTSRAI
jgi:hypothetical protein